MIGVDLESIDRFTKLNRQKDGHFLRRVFSAKELAYCYAKKDPAPSLAARFAGKEAVNKALAGLHQPALSLNKIEILNNKKGVPIVKLKKHEVKISLTHGRDQAIAVALLIKK